MGRDSRLSESAKSQVQIIYIAGLGHSGSTLVALVLGSAHSLFSAGELKFLQDYLVKENADPYLEGSPCSCGAKDIGLCPIWGKVFSRFFEKTGVPMDRYLSRVSRKEAVLHLLSSGPRRDIFFDFYLFQCICEVCGAQMVVDSSKSVNRLIRLIGGKTQIKVIHLVRDVRGVSVSYSRKGEPAWKTYLRWVNNSIVLLLLRFLTVKKKNVSWRLVSYDRFAQYPEKELKELCKFIGANYQDNMLAYYKYVSHDIAGNPMRMRKKPIAYKRILRASNSMGARILHIVFSPLNRVLVGHW